MLRSASAGPATEDPLPKPQGLNFEKLPPRDVGSVEILRAMRPQLEAKLGTALPVELESLVPTVGFWREEEPEQVEALGDLAPLWSMRNHIRNSKHESNVTVEVAQSVEERAASQLAALPEFKRAKLVRVHAHWRGQAIRLATLRAGKRLLAPQAGLRSLRILDPARIDAGDYEDAVTEGGIEKFGEPFDVDSGDKVDLFVIGSMAVNPPRDSASATSAASRRWSTRSSARSAPLTTAPSSPPRRTSSSSSRASRRMASRARTCPWTSPAPARG